MMLLSELMELYLDQCSGLNHPVEMQLGADVLRDYVERVSALPFYKRPFGIWQFNDATVRGNAHLQPHQIRFVMLDGTVREAAFAEPAP